MNFYRKYFNERFYKNFVIAKIQKIHKIHWFTTNTIFKNHTSNIKKKFLINQKSKKKIKCNIMNKKNYKIFFFKEMCRTDENFDQLQIIKAAWHA